MIDAVAVLLLLAYLFPPWLVYFRSLKATPRGLVSPPTTFPITSTEAYFFCAEHLFINLALLCHSLVPHTIKQLYRSGVGT